MCDELSINIQCSNNGTDVGAAGKQALDSVNAQLYYQQ